MTVAAGHHRLAFFHLMMAFLAGDLVLRDVYFVLKNNRSLLVLDEIDGENFLALRYVSRINQRGGQDRQHA